MSHACHHHVPPSLPDSMRQRRLLWFALWVNAAMCALELASGWQAGSVALLADAIDFFGDSASYALSLAVLGQALQRRARVAAFKGLCMLVFGGVVLARATWAWRYGAPPQALTMGWVGSLALLANLGVAALLYAFRHGDANLRSVWLCSRNDALGNLAVLAAALGVFGSGRAWPDLLVAAGMAALALAGGWAVLRQARAELRTAAIPP